MAKRIPPLVWHLGGSVLLQVVVSLLITGLSGVFDTLPRRRISRSTCGLACPSVRGGIR
jgi:hypothetical protein